MAWPRVVTMKAGDGENIKISFRGETDKTCCWVGCGQRESGSGNQG